MKLTADRQTPARSLVNSVWCEPTTKIVKSSKKCYIQFNVYRILVILDESPKWVSSQWFRKVVSMSLGWRSTSFFFAGTYFARRLREVCYFFLCVTAYRRCAWAEPAPKPKRRTNKSFFSLRLLSPPFLLQVAPILPFWLAARGSEQRKTTTRGVLCTLFLLFTFLSFFLTDTLNDFSSLTVLSLLYLPQR